MTEFASSPSHLLTLAKEASDQLSCNEIIAKINSSWNHMASSPGWFELVRYVGDHRRFSLYCHDEVTKLLTHFINNNQVGTKKQKIIMTLLLEAQKNAHNDKNVLYAEYHEWDGEDSDVETYFSDFD